MATVEELITEALEAGDAETAAGLLAVTFGHDPDAHPRTLGELLEELAECYADQGRYEDAIVTMGRALEAGWTRAPEGRCRIAEFLLREGLVDEAEAIYELVAADAPDDLDVHYGAALEHTDAGRPDHALRWVERGLAAADRVGEREGTAAALHALRDRLSAMDDSGGTTTTGTG